MIDLDKGAQNAQWKKDNLFNKWCLENWIFTRKRMNLGPYLTKRKINSKWIKDLNVRPETIKLLEENIEGNFHNIGLGNGFMDMTPKAQAA